MNEEAVPMNAGIGPYQARSMSASNEARRILANWLRTTRPLRPDADARTMLVRRYPDGLLNEAEIDALLRVIDS
jgi:hypothetical protein